MKTCGIYSIKNSVSGRAYVGSAANIQRRWSEHRSRLARGTHENQKLQRSWIKHGYEAFEFVVLESGLSVGELVSREQFWIDAMCAVSGGYNLSTRATPGSHGMRTGDAYKNIAAANKARAGIPLSDATRALMSAIHVGKKHSAESRAAIGKAHHGKVISEAHRIAIGQKMRGKPSGFRGRSHSAEAKSKISMARRRAVAGIDTLELR